MNIRTHTTRKNYHSTSTTDKPIHTTSDSKTLSITRSRQTARQPATHTSKMNSRGNSGTNIDTTASALGNAKRRMTGWWYSLPGNKWCKLAVILVCITLIICLALDLLTRYNENQHLHDVQHAHQLLLRRRRPQYIAEANSNILALQKIKAALTEVQERQQASREQIKQVANTLIERTDNIYKYEVEAQKLLDQLTLHEKMERNDATREQFSRVIRQLEHIVYEIEEILKEQKMERDEIMASELIAKSSEIMGGRRKRDVQSQNTAEEDAYIRSLTYVWEPGYTIQYCNRVDDPDYNEKD